MTDIVLAAFIEGDQVLMARRAEHKKQFPRHWDLIGGHVEAEEAVEAALVREAEEEVGLIPTIFRDVGTFNDIGTETTYHLYVVTEWLNGRPKLLGNEHSELTWVRVSDATSLHPLAHPKIISAVNLV
ncbi:MULTISPECIES: NUDIX hydrolase [unclassified Rhizobium]|uniref:NUDIX hydrolase n=1 Tax=unclassified Rhizobium TaxID=2613769 RepID=UPI001C82CC08|nr:MULTISPECIES: NUDIX domain-containing protein [unclassified Rhizobium]MBX5167020.1 NUDIX domain-containing protein [Rhizobium sp. NZLR4b]MBX5211167.1 NUDIX domain-containing protein [Rhizobium sp. NZLR11]